MNVDELFEATAQAMLAAMERDAASGWGVVIYTITKDKVNMKTIKARMDWYNLFILFVNKYLEDLFFGDLLIFSRLFS